MHPQAKSGGWSASGMIRRLNRDDAKSLQVVFPTSGEYTIQFALETKANASVKCEATIQWSVEGNYVTRKVSVVNGLSITGVAQGTKVTVRDASVGGVDTQDYLVSFQVAPGARASNGQPPTYEPAGLASSFAPGTFDVDIPADAGVTSVFVTAKSFSDTPIPEEQVYVQMVDGAGNSLKVYDPRNYGWVPLAPGTTKLVYVNATAADTIQFFGVFGVDG